MRVMGVMSGRWYDDGCRWCVRDAGCQMSGVWVMYGLRCMSGVDGRVSGDGVTMMVSGYGRWRVRSTMTVRRCRGRRRGCDGVDDGCTVRRAGWRYATMGDDDSDGFRVMSGLWVMYGGSTMMTNVRAYAVPRGCSDGVDVRYVCDVGRVRWVRCARGCVDATTTMWVSGCQRCMGRCQVSMYGMVRWVTVRR